MLLGLWFVFVYVSALFGFVFIACLDWCNLSVGLCFAAYVVSGLLFCGFCGLCLCLRCGFSEFVCFCLGF